MRRLPLTRTEITTAVFVGVLFLLSAFISNVFESQIHSFIGSQGNWGMLIYVLISICAIVIAPVSATPLIPIATALWGVTTAGILSIVSWTIGAVIAFLIGRYFGYEFVRKFVSLRKIQIYTDHISHHHLFITVILLRLIMPVDVLSYALGIFSSMPLWMYTIATALGIAPFAFVFSFVADMSLWIQVPALGVIALILYFAYRKMRKSIMLDTTTPKGVDNPGDNNT